MPFPGRLGRRARVLPVDTQKFPKARARPIHAAANRSDRHTESQSGILIRETQVSNEDERLALVLAQRSEGFSEPRLMLPAVKALY